MKPTMGGSWNGYNGTMHNIIEHNHMEMEPYKTVKDTLVEILSFATSHYVIVMQLAIVCN
jgi:hypothetical protein